MVWSSLLRAALYYGIYELHATGQVLPRHPFQNDSAGFSVPGWWWIFFCMLYRTGSAPVSVQHFDAHPVFVYPPGSARFPFRLGTTSYVIPADVVPNVAFLKERVDDVELVLFESDGFSNLPSAADIALLARYGAEYGLTYSVHLPLGIALGHDDAAVRVRSAETCRRIVALTRALPVSAYVLHAEAGEGRRLRLFDEGELRRFQELLAVSMERLPEECGVAPGMFCLENLDYPLGLLWPVVEACDLGVTLDVGHLLHHGFSLEEHLARYLHRVRVVHLHGCADGKDHQAVDAFPADSLQLLLDAFAAAPLSGRVVTLEIFSAENFARSMRTMTAALQGGMVL